MAMATRDVEHSPVRVATSKYVFTWVQRRFVDAGLPNGKPIATDATTPEGNAPELP
jgi:hypothetical protein